MTLHAQVDETLAGLFRHDPVLATERGEHSHDRAWPDLTDEGQAARGRFVRDAIAGMEGIDAATLNRDELIDRRVMLANLEAILFDAERLDESSWNPLWYVYLFGNGLFHLLARPFAPLPERLASAAARMRALPEVVDAAQARLRAGGRRPTSRFHTEKAVERIGGVADLARSAVKEAEGVDNAALRDEIAAAVDVAVGAVDRFAAFLRDELLPGASGDFRLGGELYEEKFRLFLQTDMTPAELERLARARYDEVRAEMTRLAREIWSEWMGEARQPADDGQAVRAVLDAIAVDHPAAPELLDWCSAENERIEKFVAERDLVGLTDEPLRIVWTPEFMRSFGGAMLIPPGPLDRGLDSYFAITPMPDDWPPERKESYLREDNARMLRLLTIHEAVPGHYLQLAYSNRCPSLARAVFMSGVFAEGWAVYITQVMMDVGYGSEDPALMLVHWKFYLRSITNTLMDIAIHTGSMDRVEAMRLMVDGGFQEEGEATAKWDRARLSSTQLCEYFLGSVGMHQLEDEGRRRAQLAGREFVYRPFLESVLGHGTPSLPVIRDILFGD
jgi:uncharacterized protein (DUF885 family)